MLSEIEVLELRKVGKQEWLYYVRPQNILIDFVLWQGSEETPFIRPSGKQW